MHLVNHDKGVPRFYHKATVEKVKGEDLYTVSLDGRSVVSNKGLCEFEFNHSLGNLLHVPNEEMALLLALEWEACKKSLHSNKLPLVTCFIV